MQSDLAIISDTGRAVLELAMVIPRECVDYCATSRFSNFYLNILSFGPSHVDKVNRHWSRVVGK